MKKVMVRQARDEFEAMLTAQAMLEGEAEVISIASNGQHLQQGAIQPCTRFVVFAKVTNDTHIDRVDRLIAKALDFS
jgi:hypothetical protein